MRLLHTGFRLLDGALSTIAPVVLLMPTPGQPTSPNMARTASTCRDERQPLPLHGPPADPDAAYALGEPAADDPIAQRTPSCAGFASHPNRQ